MKLKTIILSLLCMCLLAPLSISALGSSDSEDERNSSLGSSASSDSDPDCTTFPSDTAERRYELRENDREYYTRKKYNLIPLWNKLDILAENEETKEILAPSPRWEDSDDLTEEILAKFPPCKDFNDLTENLRKRQIASGNEHNEFGYIIWVNTALPADNLLDYHKWFGDDCKYESDPERVHRVGRFIMSGDDNKRKVFALLPTSFMVCASCYGFNVGTFNIEMFKNIVLDPSNWIMLRTNEGWISGYLDWEADGKKQSFEEYVTDILKSKPYKSVYLDPELPSATAEDKSVDDCPADSESDD